VAEKDLWVVTINQYENVRPQVVFMQHV